MSDLPNAIFIETSAVVDAALKREYREKISSILQDFTTKLSSNYVRMEIKRGVLSYLVYLHNKLISCSTWSDAMKAVARLSSTPQRNRLGTILESLHAFFAGIEKKTITDLGQDFGGEITFSDLMKENMASFLRLSIRRLWRQYDKMADEDLNPMSCYIDIKPPIQIGKLLDNSGRTCDKSQVECNIKRFFLDNMPLFAEIHDKLSSLPESDADRETKRRVKSLKDIMRILPYGNRRFSNVEPNFKACWDCGDAILACLAPEATPILNHNARHYVPICEAVGKRSISY